ncbi:MAG: bacterial Ig-like domain-containing protein [Propionibacteriaceae bacterium]|nr:bacterial Ig-like domain-containing protein [Propionibacteriaceae bacterium]
MQRFAAKAFCPNYCRVISTFADDAQCGGPFLLQSLTVTTPPSKTSYTQGDELSLAGMKVTVTYTDGSTKDVTTVVKVNPPAGSTLGTVGTQSIGLSYTDTGLTQTASFPVTVAAKVPPIPPSPNNAPPVTPVVVSVATGGSLAGPLPVGPMAGMIGLTVCLFAALAPGLLRRQGRYLASAR